VLVVLEALEPYPDELEERRSDHGTAASFPPLEELTELDWRDWLEGLVEAPGVLVVLLFSALLEPRVELREITAKSTLADEGFRMTSLIVPSDSPEELLIWAPINLLARTSWCPMRPVAL